MPGLAPLAPFAHAGRLPDCHNPPMLWAPPAIYGTVKDAPVPVRWFSRLLFFRSPLAEEVPDFAAAIAWARRRWPWLLAAYLVVLGVLVVPGLLRDRGLWYSVMSVVVPHLMLYLTVMMVAYSAVGYRINLANMRQFLPPKTQGRLRRWRLAIIGAISGAAGAVTGYMVAAAMKEGASLGIPGEIGRALGEWNRDTFTPGTVILIFAVIVMGVPELIAQMRLKERTMARRLGEAEATRERMARATAESELRLLQAQVEPHFLYNTLANLRYLVQTGSADALKMTDALIEYLRTSVPDMRAQHVTLGREVDHASHYLEIMTMRMGGRLRYTVDVDEALRAVPLPPLVVLTLVENAVKHGIAPRVQGGRVTVRARGDGEFVELDVEDDGVGLGVGEGGKDPLSTGTGLANIANRLGIVYGERASIHLMPLGVDGRGTRARLRVPLTMPPDEAGAARIVVLNREEGERLLAQAGAAAPLGHPPSTQPSAPPSVPSSAP
jgi:signal transduction histidine kinase